MDIKQLLQKLAEDSNDPMLVKFLSENEHVLTSPEIIGTDEEKISAISYWSSVIGLYRTLNSLMVSYNNKINMITAMRKELDIVELEIQNTSAEVKDDGESVPGMYQDTDAAPDEAVIDIGNKTISTEEKEQKKKALIEKMQRAAGTFYLSKKVSVLDTYKK